VTKLTSVSDSVRRPLVVGLLALAVLTSPVLAETVQTSWQGKGALVVRAASAQVAGALVEFPDGENMAIDLPEGATLNSISQFTTVDGEVRWLLAGSKEGAPDGADGSQLFFLTGDGSAGDAGSDVREVLPPAMAGETPALRVAPVLMQNEGDLQGLVWLQGSSTRTLEIWAADWREGSFDDPQRVVAAGPGSQLALSGAVLHDGSWLLAWSRFDGEDDEIATVRRVDGEWQERSAISHNRVPDITPTVVATDEGALVAWSRFERTGYRLRLRSLTAAGWANPRSMAEEKALYPRFVEGGDRALRLVYRRSSPRSWVVADLDATGTVRRQAAVRTDDDSVPAVLEQGDGYVLRFSSAGATNESRATPETPSQVSSPERPDERPEARPEG
jgi:hypothetical protein